MPKESKRSYLFPEEVELCIKNVRKLSCYNQTVLARKPLPIKSFQMLIKVCFQGALRIGEATELRVNNFDLDTYLVTLPKTKTGYVWCKCAQFKKKKERKDKKILISADPNCEFCKGRGKREVPQYTNIGHKLTTEFIHWFEDEGLKGSAILFKSPSFDTPISERFVQYKLIELGELLHLPIKKQYKVRVTKNMYSHIFRRSFAKMMERDGFILSEIAKKLRHTNLKTTSTYLEADLDDLQSKELEKYG